MVTGVKGIIPDYCAQCHGHGRVLRSVEEMIEGHDHAAFGAHWICSEVRRRLGLPDHVVCQRYLDATKWET